MMRAGTITSSSLVALVALPFAIGFQIAGGPPVPPARTAQVGPPPVAPSPNSCLPGTGSRNWCGDGRPATSAKLAGPTDVVAAPDGTLFIADTLNNVIRRVGPDGVITTVAGDGIPDAPQAVEPAATASFAGPRGVAYEAAGSLLVADTDHDSIRRVAPDGTVTTVVGGSDGVLVGLARPSDVVALPGGAMLVVDTGHHRVLRISAAGGVRRVAGTGRPGFTRRHRRGASSALRAPTQVAPLARGDLLIADTGNRAVRWLARGRLRTVAVLRSGRSPFGVAASGGRVVVSTSAAVLNVTRSRQVRIAGTGKAGFTGDAGRDVRTALSAPRQLATAPDGTLLIAEMGSDRIRRLRVGQLVTVAGSDTPMATPASASGATALRAPRALLNCYASQPRFRVFGFVPLSVDTLRGSRRRVTLKIVTSRVASVALRLTYGSTLKRHKALRRVKNTRPRKVVLRVRLRAGRRYTLQMTGRGLGIGIVRCDRRGVVAR